MSVLSDNPISVPPPLDPVGDLSQKIELLRREVDGLQAAAAERSTPWYRKFSTVLSVTALLFSFGTTFVSYQRTKVQDIENKRQELRTLLQRLAALPKEGMEMTKRYTSDPATINLIGGYISQETNLLAHHAVEVVKALPEGSVSAGEYYAIGLSLQNSFDLNTSGTFLENAVTRSTDFWTEIAALRTIAATRFAQGHAEKGRVEYQRALDIFSKYPGYDLFTKASTNVLTEINWAFSEASNGSLPQGNQHIANAYAVVLSLPPSPGSARLNDQVIQAQAQLNSGNPANTLPPGVQLGSLPPVGAK